jgi:hypothetical protein
MPAMEPWDLVKLHGRSMRSGHFIEAVAVGYQLLETVFVVLLTKTLVGKSYQPMAESVVDKADNLLSKAKLALENDFIDQTLFDEVKTFNKMRADLMHNIVKKNVDYESAEACAMMVTELYRKVQGRFLTYTIT